VSNWPPTEEQFQRYLERERRASRRHHLIFWATIAAMVVDVRRETAQRMTGGEWADLQSETEAIDGDQVL
jgi:hypothetical protein